MRISGYLISLFFLFNGYSTLSQDLVIHPDSVKGKFIPTGVRFGAEAINIVRTFTGDDLTELTFIADVDFYRYFLNVEFGVFERTRQNAIGQTYDISGTYFRVGPEVNFLKKDPEKCALFFGLRYGWTSLDDELRYSSPSGFYPTDENVISNSGLSASWFEMVTGLKVKIWKYLWLGYTARFKFGVDTFERNELIPHEIPGFGRADETVIWDFDYWLMFRIPIRKAPTVLFDE